MENFDQEALFKELYELLEIADVQRYIRGRQVCGEYNATEEHKQKVLEFLKWSDKVEQVFSFGDYAGGTVDRYWVFRYKDQLYRFDATINSWDNGNDSSWYNTDSLRPVNEHTRIERYYE